MGGFLHFISSMVLPAFIILLAVVILLERRNPTKTVAWLLILVFLPFLGFILYMLFGKNWRKNRWIKQKELIDYSVLEDFIEKYIDNILADKGVNYVLGSKERLMYLLIHSADAPLTINNRLTVLKDASEKYPELFKMIKDAKHHIHLEYYIIRDDEVGDKLTRMLMEKAREGVEIRLLYDGVGSSKFGRKNRKKLIEAGVKVSVFLPVWFPFLNSKLNYRNHRKIVVVDGTKALVGGINIGREYLGRDKRFGYWRDTHLKIEGDGAYSLQLIFLLDWCFAYKEKINFLKYFPKQEKYREKNYVQIAASGPDSQWESIHKVYFSIISTAEDSLYITSPYFIPDDSIMMALKTAALSGVDVRLLIPGEPDHKIVYWASHSYLEEIMEAGVRVYLYEKGFIHAKVIIADGTVASIGTANMDLRSFHHNFEANAFVYDREVVEDIESQFFQDLDDSRELILEEYRMKSLPVRLRESTARLLSPLL
jgi:cardiolipin synthase